MWVVKCHNVHVDRPEHGVSLNRVKILTVESKKFERVKEAIYIRVTMVQFSMSQGVIMFQK